MMSMKMRGLRAAVYACLTTGFALVVGTPGHLHEGGYGEAGFVVQGAVGVALLLAAARLADRVIDGGS